MRGFFHVDIRSASDQLNLETQEIFHQSILIDEIFLVSLSRPSTENAYVACLSDL